MADKRVIDRLDEYCAYRGYNDTRITKDCALGIGTLNKSRKSGRDLSLRTIENILKTYTDLDRDWLLHGKGEMLTKDRPSDYASYPLVDTTKAECGTPAGFAEAIMADNLPHISVPGIPGDTAFFIVANGQSMINDAHPELSIPPGALVGVSRLREAPLIRWGEVYVISTTDGIIIKKITEDDNPEYIKCISYNSKEYPPFRLSKSEIFECGRITCVIPVYTR